MESPRSGALCTLAEIKRIVRGDASRSTPIAIAILALDVALHAGLLAGVLILPWWGAAACAPALGLTTGLLFVVAHDACHGSFTASPATNRWISRLCFLPSLFPVSPWELGHNQLHHGWTNLKSKDYVWRPFSLQEYQRLPAWRRCLERRYRTVVGVALYAIVEIWWKHMIWLSPEDRRHLESSEQRRDRGLVLLYLATVSFVLLRVGAGAFVLGAVVPWLTFTWLFGAVILQHHTHPRARWFESREEWTFYKGQVQNTVDLEFPPIVNVVLHNITVHGAHHVDPKLPLYELKHANARLVNSFGDDMIRARWSLTSLRDLLRVCRLYDYRQHLWLDFDGTPTTAHPRIPNPGPPNASARR